VLRIYTEVAVFHRPDASCWCYWKCAGALSGLSATVIFHSIQARIGLVATGAVGILWQLLCLLIGVVPVVLQHIMACPSGSNCWMPPEEQLPLRKLLNTLYTISDSSSNSSRAPAGVAGVVAAADLHTHMAAPPIHTRMLLQSNATATAASSATGAGVPTSTAAPAQLYLLLCGLVASRLGLWLFDLTVLQIQQESVEIQELGKLSTICRLSLCGQRIYLNRHGIWLRAGLLC
jgi:hypothetical protein